MIFPRNGSSLATTANYESETLQRNGDYRFRCLLFVPGEDSIEASPQAYGVARFQ